MSDLVVYPYRYPSAPVSTPLPVTSGLVGRWDASSLAFADGAVVTSWPDGSGAGRHMTPVATGPIAKTAVQNGLTVARFDGVSNQALRAAGTTVVPKHVFAVAKASAATFPNFNGLLTGVSAGNEQVFLLGSQGASTWFIPGGAATYHRDGVADTTNTGPMNTWSVMSMTNTTLWTGAVQFQIGDDRNVTNRYWVGDVGEIVAYDRVLSAAERAQVEEYLSAKWGTFPVLTGLARWYRADDTATVTSSAGSVSQWIDKAGGNDNLTQATAGLRPVTGTRTLNGRNVLDFDGSGDYLGTTTSLALPLTTFIVARSDIAATAVERTILAGQGNTCALNIDVGEQFYVYMGGPSNFMFYGAGANLLNLNAHIWSFTLSDTAASTSRLDGAEIVATGAGSFGSNFTTVGGHATTATWDGIIGEVIQYSRVLTPTECRQVETYLAGQWGITLA
jgi:hypothetical protein